MDKKETIERIIEYIRAHIEGIDVTYDYGNDTIKIDDDDIDFHFTQNISIQIEMCQFNEDYLKDLSQNICGIYMRELF